MCRCLLDVSALTLLAYLGQFVLASLTQHRVRFLSLCSSVSTGLSVYQDKDAVSQYVAAGGESRDLIRAPAGCSSNCDCFQLFL